MVSFLTTSRLSFYTLGRAEAEKICKGVQRARIQIFLKQKRDLTTQLSDGASHSACIEEKRGDAGAGCESCRELASESTRKASIYAQRGRIEIMIPHSSEGGIERTCVSQVSSLHHIGQGRGERAEIVTESEKEIRMTARQLLPGRRGEKRGLRFRDVWTMCVPGKGERVAVELDLGV